MRTLGLLLGALCAFVLVGDSRYTEDFHYTYPQAAGGRLVLDNFNGSVEITGWDQNTVDISGAKYANSRELLNAIRIEASSSGSEVRVRTIRPDHSDHGNLGARYVIRVPRRTELQNVQSSNGSLRVEDVEGRVQISTSNGSVHISRVRGDVDARSSNGGVELNDVAGGVSLRTSNGSIHAGNVQGAFEASTSNGAVEAHLRNSQAGQPVRLHTSNGSIELGMDSFNQNDVIASTSNASITLRLPGSVQANLHASTNSGGSVRSDFDVLMRGELSRHRIDGTIGGGGPRLELTTSNANISLLRN